MTEVKRKAPGEKMQVMNEIIKRHNVRKRLAIVMSLVMALGLLPDSLLQVRAENAEVVITVTDDDGVPVEGAFVSYRISQGSVGSVSGDGTGAVSGDSVSGNGPLPEIRGSGTTDGEGKIAAVIPAFMEGMAVSLEISKEEFGRRVVPEQPLEADMRVSLRKIPEIQALNGVYNGVDQALVSVSGSVNTGDVIRYSVDGVNWQANVPTGKAAGQYAVYVQVSREGYEPFASGELKAVIQKAVLGDVGIIPCEADYDEGEHAALSFSGLEAGDRVTCTYRKDGADTDMGFVYDGVDSVKVPTIQNAGEYEINVKVERENYETYEEKVKAVINPVDIRGLTAAVRSGLVYNGQDQELLDKIIGLKDGDRVSFVVSALGDEPQSKEWTEWTEENRPRACDAGIYKVRVKVERDNYNETEIIPCPEVCIQRAEPELQFAEEPEADTVDFDRQGDNTYNFSVICNALQPQDITYSVENAAMDDDTDIGDIASIVESGENAGKLTITQAGHIIRITAATAGSENYTSVSQTYVLAIRDTDEDLIGFEKREVSRTLKMEDVIFEQAAEKSHEDDNGEITYEGKVTGLAGELKDFGIELAGSGRVSVKDLELLSEVLEKEGSLSLVITASKGEGTKEYEGGTRRVYAGCRTSYTILLSTEEIPDEAYTKYNPEGEEILPGNLVNGWHNTAVTVRPAEGYTIARDKVTNAYGDSVVFGDGESKKGDQGEKSRIIYLRNEDGGITAPITIDLYKLDNEKPYDLHIHFPEPVLHTQDKVKYYDGEITVVFTAKDDTSGVDRFCWSYVSLDGAGSAPETVRGELEAQRDKEDPTRYTASLTLPGKEAAQLRGRLEVSVRDAAGNDSDILRDDAIFVVDTIAPERTVTYGLQDAGGTSQTLGRKHYFSGSVDFAFQIEEANFFAEDVHITVSKDGGAALEQTVTWESAGIPGAYVAGLTLSDDGEYVVGMTYTDRSGNEMPSYTSEIIVVDATAPVIEFNYDDYSGEKPQTATITVTEHNFRQSDIAVTTEAKTITDQDVTVEDLQEYLRNCRWEHEGDVHRAYLSDQFADAIYVLTCNYNDLALNPAAEVRTEPFVVDHTPPSADRMSVSYSASVKDTVLSAITLGFYNPAVTVTFTAYDDTAGVDYFTWSYKRQEGVSTQNVEQYADMQAAAVQDSVDRAKFTASVTLPGEQARQLRGMIAFTATDRYGNVSDPLTDSGHVLVVDTIPPVITAEYTPPDDISGGKLYYSKALTATFTVTEANFFSEDVVVTLAKDKEDPVRVEPVWTDISADVHVGTYRIDAPDNHAGDGDYVFTVNYTDRSGNIMEVYTSAVLVIDTISPEQRVSYGLRDEGGTFQTAGTKHYFSGPVDFVFNITETNLFAEDVHITVSKDGGAALEQAVTWNLAGAAGEYEAGLTLADDGDYVVVMTYTDRTGNEMPPYISETIVVDATAPVIAFSYADHSGENPQTATVTVTEHNFRQSDMVVTTEAKTITDQGVSVEDLQNYLRNCQWEHEGDVHRAYLSDQFADAIYVLTCNYKDLALNPAAEVRTDPFVVDHTPPSTDRMSVSYSTSVKETILATITLGFYNPMVTVTFTAYDDTAGVDYFTWSYTRQQGVSQENVELYEDTQIAAVQDPVDRAKFTASVTLPEEQARQLRGTIAFTAADKYGNVSEKLTDSGHVLVVDTISPVITAEYTPPDNTFGGKLYYNKALTATFTVTEANFFSEDVIVMLTKDNEAPVQVTPVWTDISADVHVGTYVIDAPDNHAGDGDYVFTINYTDRSDNTMDVYTSDVFVIDTILPVIEVEYSDENPVNTLADGQGIARKYFPAQISATLTVTEHNFNPEDVAFIINATDVAGNALDAEALYRSTGGTSDGDSNTATIVYPGDANYSFDIEYTDLALHEMADYPTDYFTVDTSMPEPPEISYSASVLDTILANISFGFYNARVTVQITAVDRISGVHGFEYGYLRADGVSAVNAELAGQPIEEAQISFSEGGAAATASFQISQAELAAGNQFNGAVRVSATDRAGNRTDDLQDARRIVVDNIAPTATVEYNVPVQEVNNISYYDGDISATVTINEANFYSEDVTVSVTRDGAPYGVTPVWNDNNADVHTGTFTLTGDGDYFVEITYSDKSGNAMQQYMSQQMTIDTQIEEAVITVNGADADGKAFKDQVVLAVSFEDKNFEDYEILLTRTNYANKNIDVTEQFIGGQVTTNAFGGAGSFDTFSRSAENDGIYTVTVSLSDRAGHTVEKTATFTVNRYGSVYEYSDYLVELIRDGGAFVQRVEEDLLITEYNADRLVDQSLNIEISRDGKPLEDYDYKVTPKSDAAVTGNKDWYQYQYNIPKENFSEDGVYKISVSSRDQTGNTPENTNYEDKAILFRVDSTAPEINSVTGLESAIVNATSLEIKYTVYDTMGLASVAVYVDGKEKEDITDFAGDEQNYFGSIFLTENPQAQKVRLVVTDLAGNVTDTDAENFISAYAFSPSVTISTNAIVRWYADKALFWGSIGGAMAAAGTGTGAAILFLRRRRLLAKA